MRGSNWQEHRLVQALHMGLQQQRSYRIKETQHESRSRPTYTHASKQCCCVVAAIESAAESFGAGGVGVGGLVGVTGMLVLLLLLLL
jgi:hypothetical protein